MTSLSTVYQMDPTIVAHEENDIPTFYLVEENDLDMSSSTITLDRSPLTNEEKGVSFLEA